MLRWVMVVALGLAVVGCEGGSTGDCGGTVCSPAERCELSSQTCVPDEAPTLTLEGPGGTVSAATFAVRGTVRDDVQVLALQWSLDEQEWTDLEARQGDFSFTVPSGQRDAAALTVTVRAKDAIAATARRVEVLVDTLGPSVELLAPDAGTLVPPGEVTLTVRVDDGSHALGAVTVNGAPVTAVEPGTPFTTPVTVPTGLDATPFELVLAAEDALGNRTEVRTSLASDNVGPHITFLRPAADGGFVSGAAMAVEVEVADGSPVVGVEVAVALDGGLVPATEQAGRWVASVPLPPMEAAREVVVTALDAHGNRGTARVTANIDTLPPEIALAAPAPNSPNRGPMAVRVDDARVTSPVVAVEGRFLGLTPSAFTGQGTQWTGALPTPPGLDLEARDFEVTARDAAGNATTLRRTVLVDDVAPRITFTWPSANQKLNAADFGGGDEISVRWTIADGDPSRVVNVAGRNVTPVDDAHCLVTVPPSEPLGGYGVTVQATDRAGNSSTETRAFTVDRVVPTVTAFTPADGARNVTPRRATIAFSEPVFGPTTSSEALAFTPAVAAPGTWNAEHTEYTSAALAPWAAYSVSVAGLADDHGNPVAPDTRRFHTEVTIAAGTTLMTGVAAFEARADQDGLVTVAAKTLAAPDVGQETVRVFRLSPTTGAPEAPLYTSTQRVIDFGLSAWRLVNADLSATSRVAATVQLPPPFGTNDEFRYVTAGGTAPGAMSGFGASALLSLPPLPLEPGTADFGTINQGTYTRQGGAGSSVALGLSPAHRVAQSSRRWAAFAATGTEVKWARVQWESVRPGVGQPAAPTLVLTTTAVPTTSSTRHSMAMNPGGTCLLAAWLSGSQPVAAVQPLSPCHGTNGLPLIPLPASCESATTWPTVTPGGELRVAPFSGGGADTLLVAERQGAAVRLRLLAAPATCDFTFTEVPGGTLTDTALSFEPVQAGNKAGLLYVDSSYNLKLWVP